MGKLACICGNILSDTCGGDAEIFVEEQIERIGGCVEDHYYPMGDGRGILECEECGTLAIEDPINSATVKFYRPYAKKIDLLFRGEKNENRF